MKAFGWILAILVIGAITILALDMVNGGQILAWLDDHTGLPQTGSRFTR